jgi:hypothetical protein
MARQYRDVSIIVERPGRKPFFAKSGVAFDNRDGSLNVKLHIHPGVTFHVGNAKEVNGGEERVDAPEDKDTPF